MADDSLKDAVAVLTGSSAGIALEIACRFAEAGARGVMLNGRGARSDALATQAIAAVKARAPACEVGFHTADATAPAEVGRLIESAIATFGRIDILVNSVGGGLSPRPFTETPPAAFTELAHRHLLSTLHGCHAVLPHMISRGTGVILNMSSDAGKVATPGETVIGALKAAVIMFTRTLSLEVSRFGIRTHCITPSIVRSTPNYDRLMADDFSRKLFEKAEARARLGATTPAHIAELALFLASPAAANMTGQVISVNGGISAA